MVVAIRAKPIAQEPALRRAPLRPPEKGALAVRIDEVVQLRGLEQ